MIPRTLALLGALLNCSVLAAQDTLHGKNVLPFYPILRKDAGPAKARPYAPVLRNNLFLRGDTGSLPWPVTAADSIRWRIRLKTVDIRSNKYREDSLALRASYGKAFNFQPPKFKDVVSFPQIINTNPEGKVRYELGIAINISLLDDVFARKRNTGQKKFRERLERYEREKFNEQYFTASLVGRFIPLRGDSLDYFTDTYRPDHAFLRSASAYDLGVYVKAQYQRYLDSMKKAGAGTGF